VGESCLITGALLALAYLFGAIPTGLLVVRAVRGVDIRTQGSGNIGATNVVRVAGWGWGLGTLLFDALKGAAPLLALAWLDWSPAALVRWQIVAGALALAGNLLNPFLGFRGGKGVGTAIGIAAVIAPASFGWGLCAFALGFAATRIVSVGSLAAGAVFAATAGYYYLTGQPRPPTDWVVFCIAVGAMIFYTHRKNIGRLVRGEEARLTRSK